MAQSFCSRYIEENETLSGLQISVFKLSGTVSAVWENQQAENLCLKCRAALITASSFESVRLFPFDGGLHAGAGTQRVEMTHPSSPHSKLWSNGKALPSRGINCGFFPKAFNVFSLLSINCLRLLAIPGTSLLSGSAFCMLGKRSAVELHPRPPVFFFFVVVLTLFKKYFTSKEYVGVLSILSIETIREGSVWYLWLGKKVLIPYLPGF